MSSPLILGPGFTLGALQEGAATSFRVWAPKAESVELHLVAPQDILVPMAQEDRGYFQVTLTNVAAGARYLFRLDGALERPDPASRFQPEGVHAASQVTSRDFSWTDSGWAGPDREALVLYELHPGTFTREGSFEAILEQLPHLHRLGVNAIELMPVAQFPGNRNWGYDGVYPFAAQSSYGGPEGLRRLVDGCHAQGMAVYLDVVYNHFGPEGNYTLDFGPYFTDRYATPWGSALNFDGPGSDEVRRFFIASALYWFEDCHVDGFRLDSVDDIMDLSPVHFLEEFAAALHERARQIGRPVQVVAESDKNDPRVVRPLSGGGFGLDAQWSDSFHHSIHAMLTGERDGYYADFGAADQVTKVFNDGFVYTGEYSATRRRRHGAPAPDVPGSRFVVFIQNHDQIGNRMLGDRLCSLLPFEAVKLSAGLLLLSPYVPLLFMGEEYAEKAPFQYFVSHSGPDLIQAVREGRKREFDSFSWKGEPPDPQAPETFERSRPNLDLASQGRHAVVYDFYRELIRMRSENAALRGLDRDGTKASMPANEVVLLHRRAEAAAVFALFNFGADAVGVSFEAPAGDWRKQLDSAATLWDGPGDSAPESLTSGAVSISLPAHSFVLYERDSVL